LSQIELTDEIIITSMMPHATPDECVYMNFVDAKGTASVYRANSQSRTWLTQSLNELSTELFVHDVSAITNNITQQVITPTLTAGYYNIGLTAEKRILASVKVMNNTTGQLIANNCYKVVVENLSPILRITAGIYITTGDSLTITTVEGNTVYINGEQISFTTVNFATNSLSGLRRGVNGTAMQLFIPKYTNVFGTLASNKLSDVYYHHTWNSYVYNSIVGDPLQCSDTIPSIFLLTDGT
jgi:hypothetical protein